MPLLDKLREQYGVGPVCSELHIAPSTYYHCQQQRHHPDTRRAGLEIFRQSSSPDGKACYQPATTD